MQKILMKRVVRNLIHNLPRYLALLFLILLSIATVLCYATSGDTVIKDSVIMAKEDNVEDGEFSTIIPLTSLQKKELSKMGVFIEDAFYIDFEQEDESTLRAFKNRNSINKIHLVHNEGKLATKKDECVIERRYAEVHNLKINDKIKIADLTFNIVALGTTPDYEGPLKTLGDISVNSERFGNVFVSEDGYKLLKESGKMSSAEEYLYTYEILNENTTNKEIKEKVKSFSVPCTEISVLASFVEKKNNLRIESSKSDAEINLNSALFLGVIVIILLSYIIAVFVTHEIEKDKQVIGTLYSLGVTRRDLLFHYLQLSVLITFIGGVLGYLIGTSDAACRLMLIEDTSYFSLPDLTIQKDPIFIMYALLMPPFIAIIVNISVIAKKLNRPVLSLLKNESKVGKIKEVKIKIGKDNKNGFIKRFRLRQLIREFRSALVVVLGIFMSYIILTMGINCYTFCSSIQRKNKEDIAFKNMYTLKYLQDEDSEEFNKGTGCYGKVLTKNVNGFDFDITVLGIKEENDFFPLHFEKEECVSISDSVASKYNVEIGDEITLKDEGEEKEYSFIVDEIIEYSPSFFVFMDIDEARKLFDSEDGKVNIVLSNEDLDIEKDKLYNTLTDKDIIKSGEIFIALMWGLIYTLLIASTILFVFVMYLMMKVMIDRSANNISLFRVFGYEAKEIRKLYLDGNFIVVAIGSLIALPLAKVIMDYAYPTFLVANVASGIYIKYPFYYYIIIYVATLVLYLIINNLLMIKIKKIKECEILRNRE